MTETGELHLARPGYLRPTPRGAALAVRQSQPSPVGALVRRMLGEPAAPWLDLATLPDLTGVPEEGAATRLLHEAQEAGAVELLDTPTEAPTQPLAELLGLVSHEEKAVLAVGTGEVLAHSGMDEARARRLAGVGADAMGLLDRYGAPSDVALPGWSIVDADGVSRLGAWVLHLTEERLVLVVDGIPRLRHPAFTALVWAATRQRS